MNWKFTLWLFLHWGSLHLTSAVCGSHGKSASAEFQPYWWHVHYQHTPVFDVHICSTTNARRLKWHTKRWPSLTGVCSCYRLNGGRCGCQSAWVDFFLRLLWVQLSSTKLSCNFQFNTNRGNSFRVLQDREHFICHIVWQLPPTPKSPLRAKVDLMVPTKMPLPFLKQFENSALTSPLHALSWNSQGGESCDHCPMALLLLEKAQGEGNKSIVLYTPSRLGPHSIIKWL